MAIGVSSRRVNAAIYGKYKLGIRIRLEIDVLKMFMGYCHCTSDMSIHGPVSYKGGSMHSAYTS